MFHPIKEEEKMGRRVVVLAAAMAGVVFMAAGIALAANVISCPRGLCQGTTGDDAMTARTPPTICTPTGSTTACAASGPSTTSAADRGTTPSTGEGATTSKISTRSTGEWTASPPTALERRPG